MSVAVGDATFRCPSGNRGRGAWEWCLRYLVEGAMRIGRSRSGLLQGNSGYADPVPWSRPNAAWSASARQALECFSAGVFPGGSAVPCEPQCEHGHEERNSDLVELTLGRRSHPDMPGPYAAGCLCLWLRGPALADGRLAFPSSSRRFPLQGLDDQLRVVGRPSLKSEYAGGFDGIQAQI
jgi:hypothetical protein